MKRASWFASWALFLGAPALAAPLEVYGRLPAIEQVAVSPDGRLLALVVTNGEERKIVVEPVDSKTPIAVLNGGLHHIRWIRFAGSNHILLAVSSVGGIAGLVTSKLETTVVTDFNIAKGSQRPLLTAPIGGLNILIGGVAVRVIRNKPYAYLFGPSLNGLVLYKVDLEASTQTVIEHGIEHTVSFAMDGEGNVVAEADRDPTKGVWTLRSWAGHRREIYTATEPSDPPELIGMGRDDLSVTVADHKDGAEIIWELPLAGGAPGKSLATYAYGAIFDRRSDRLIGTESLDGDQYVHRFFSAEDQKIWDALQKTYAPANVLVESFSDDRRTWVLRIDSPTEGPAFAVVDLQTKKGRYIGDEYLGLSARDIAEVRPVTFPARDGLALGGYLTLPRTKTPRGLLLVVLIHDGPEGRDVPGFDWMSQALASRGYAVLRTNYRGSANVTPALQNAGYGQLGRKMQSDLADGVTSLAKEGLIDPSRVCFVGRGLGGFAAATASIRDNLRCAVSIDGYFDLKAYYDWREQRSGRSADTREREWSRYTGDPTKLSDISPQLHAADMRAPILIIHGDDDLVAPADQSRAFAGTLRRLGKPVDYIELKGEDHTLSHGATRLEMLQATVAFLEKNNPPN